MVIKVGINGFGRIGRIMFRTCVQNPNVEVTAINDPAINVEYICYLIKFDSTHGNFNGDIVPFNDDIKINGNLVKFFREKLPSSVQWHLAGVQYVIESSGMFTNYEKAVGHIAAEGVRRVVVTAPSADVPMLIMGVNNDEVKPDHKVISSASSTLYCLATIIKVLENDFGVAEGFVTSIHAMTPSLKPLDGLCLRGKHWRDYRSIHQNIIPATTGACKALGKVMPQLKDKLVGLAFRVPIVNVSVLDLTVRLNKDTSLQKIIESVENASRTYLKGVLNISNEEAVSSDFMRDTHSCILDVKSSIQHKPNFYKFICWYENEFSYACRVIDTILFSEKQLSRAHTAQIKNKSLIVKKKHIIQHPPESFRHFVTLGSDCNEKVLPAVLRNGSKAFEFKINSLSTCLPFRRKMPAKVTVINQTTSPCEARCKSKSDIFKIIDYDSVPDPSCFHKIDRDSCITLKLISNDETKKDHVHDQRIKDMIKAQEEVSRMMKATRALLKKSNVCNINKNNEKEPSKDNVKVNDNAVDNSKVEDDAMDKVKVKNDAKDKEKVKEDAKDEAIVKDHAVDAAKVKREDVDSAKVIKDDLDNAKVKKDHLDNAKVKKDDLDNAKVEGATQNEEVKGVQNPTFEECAQVIAKEIAKVKELLMKHSNMEEAGTQNANIEEESKKRVIQAKCDKSTSTVIVGVSSHSIDRLKHKNGLLEYSKSDPESETANEFTDSSETHAYDKITDDDDVNTVATPKFFKGDFELINADGFPSASCEEGDEDGRVILERLLGERPFSINVEDMDSDTSIELSDVDLSGKEDDCIQQTINESKLKVGNITNCRGCIDITKRLKNNTAEYTNKYVITGNIGGKKEKGESKIFRHDYRPTIDEQNKSLKKKLSGETIKLELCQDEQNISIRASFCNTEPDIYDKLDSASATNSENSFDVNEKKSQVVRINDLTKSLEDLGRLEKICKIIEISDDLSDVLFAKLQVNDKKEIKNKKWSFKDLCEKINLDDFCNKVFHESNI